MAQEPWPRHRVLLLTVAFEGGLAILAWPLGWLLQHRPLATLTGSLPAVGLGLLAAVPMIGGGLIFSWWPVGPLRRIRQFVDEFLRPFFLRCTLADLAGISLLAGIGEEMLFRGVVQAYLMDRLGRWTGLGLASVVFGLLHAITPTYAVLATLAGIYLGVVWLATGNLLVVIVAHAVYDFVILTYLLRSRSEPEGT